MRRRFVTAALATLGFALAGLSAEPSARAQEIQLTGPLKGAPAVRRMRLYREGRFELAPTASFTLLDEYRRTILFGARLQYNIKEWIGIGVWGAYGAISSTTDLTDKIDNTAPRGAPQTLINVAPNCPSGGNCPNHGSPTFADQTAKLSYVFAPQVQLVPFRGKLAIFQKIFLDTDLYFHLGVAFVGLQERPDCGLGQCSGAASFNTSSRSTVTGTGGLGLSFYASNFIAFGVEYRVLPFSWNRAGFDSRGTGSNNNFPDQQINSQDRTFSLNQMITVDLAFALPSEPKVSE